MHYQQENYNPYEDVVVHQINNHNNTGHNNNNLNNNRAYAHNNNNVNHSSSSSSSSSSSHSSSPSSRFVSPRVPLSANHSPSSPSYNSSNNNNNTNNSNYFFRFPFSSSTPSPHSLSHSQSSVASSSSSSSQRSSLLVRRRNIVVLGFSMVGKTAICLRFASDRFDDRFDEAYEPTCQNSFGKIIKTNSTHANNTTNTNQNKQKNKQKKQQEIECCIKDTQGLGDQEILGSEYGLGYHGYILVYSIASRRSFEVLKSINEKLLNLTGTMNVPRVLVGNKTDLDINNNNTNSSSSSSNNNNNNSNSLHHDRRSKRGSNLNKNNYNNNSGTSSGSGNSSSGHSHGSHSGRQVSREEGQRLADEWGCQFVECSAKLNVNIDAIFNSLLTEIEAVSEPEVKSNSSCLCSCSSCSLLCCNVDPGVGDLEFWEKWTSIAISITLLFGLISIAFGLIIGIYSSSLTIPFTDNVLHQQENHTAADSCSLSSYLFFGSGVILSLMSIIGLYGVSRSSNDFIKSFIFALPLIMIAQIAMIIASSTAEINQHNNNDNDNGNKKNYGFGVTCIIALVDYSYSSPSFSPSSPSSSSSLPSSSLSSSLFALCSLLFFLLSCFVLEIVSLRCSYLLSRLLTDSLLLSECAECDDDNMNNSMSALMTMEPIEDMHMHMPHHHNLNHNQEPNLNLNLDNIMNMHMYNSCSLDHDHDAQMAGTYRSMYG